jgi:DNA-directed RNA polymerase subunit RPC12/RpoP
MDIFKSHVKPKRKGAGMFGRIKDGIDRGVMSVSVKSGTYLETEKLRVKAENVEKSMRETATEMGLALYGQWKTGAIKTEYLEVMCGHMREMEKEISGYHACMEELEQEKEKILGREKSDRGRGGRGTACACGHVNEPGAGFCVQCGKPLEGEDKKEDTKRVCPSCGMEMEQWAKFCAGCGKEIEKERYTNGKKREDEKNVL